jgi:hypothetical protein
VLICPSRRSLVNDTCQAMRIISITSNLLFGVLFLRRFLRGFRGQRWCHGSSKNPVKREFNSERWNKQWYGEKVIWKQRSDFCFHQFAKHFRSCYSILCLNCVSFSCVTGSVTLHGHHMMQPDQSSAQQQPLAPPLSMFNPLQGLSFSGQGQPGIPWIQPPLQFPSTQMQGTMTEQLQAALAQLTHTIVCSVVQNVMGPQGLFSTLQTGNFQPNMPDGRQENVETSDGNDASAD